MLIDSFNWKSIFIIQNYHLWKDGMSKVKAFTENYKAL